MTIHTISTTALAMLLTSACTVVVKDEATTLATGTTTTETDAEETADTAASDNGWTPYFFQTSEWIACIDGETQEAHGFDDSPISLYLLVTSESQSDYCYVTVTADGPLQPSKSSWGSDFWAAYELTPGSYNLSLIHI